MNLSLAKAEQKRFYIFFFWNGENFLKNILQTVRLIFAKFQSLNLSRKCQKIKEEKTLVH